jgi:hypothetical protein
MHDKILWSYLSYIFLDNKRQNTTQDRKFCLRSEFYLIHKKNMQAATFRNFQTFYSSKVEF